jgi:hypothetical protein
LLSPGLFAVLLELPIGLLGRSRRRKIGAR